MRYGVAGVMILLHADAHNHEHPHLHAIWQPTHDVDIPHDVYIPRCVHTGFGGSPYGRDAEEAVGSHLLRHLITHPCSSLRSSMKDYWLMIDVLDGTSVLDQLRGGASKC